jgi:hypothetical protein
MVLRRLTLPLTPLSMIPSGLVVPDLSVTSTRPLHSPRAAPLIVLLDLPSRCSRAKATKCMRKSVLSSHRWVLMMAMAITSTRHRWFPSSGAQSVTTQVSFSTFHCQSDSNFYADPTEYTIKHQIEQQTGTPSVLFSATYKFRYPIEAASHRGRVLDSSSEFDMKTGQHPAVGAHYSFDCTPTSDDAFGSLTDMTYSANNELGTLFEPYGGNTSLPSTPRSEASMSSGYGRSGESSPTSNQWFFAESSQMNYVCICTPFLADACSSYLLANGMIPKTRSGIRYIYSIM